jgi:hypothetical protein
VIGYAFHTHPPQRRGGWTSGVPNPDDDGIWFHIDLHDPDSQAQIHTQPVVFTKVKLGKKIAFLLMLEGGKTKPAAGRIWEIIQDVAKRPPPPAARKKCFCFDWVHLAEFGRECHASLPSCRAASKAWGNSGMRTPCKTSLEEECGKWGCESPGGPCRKYGCPPDAGTPPDKVELRLAGTIVSIAAAPVQGSTKNWVVTLKVDKVLQGSFDGDTFAFRVHSPTKSRLAVGRHVELVAQPAGDGYVVDDQQWLKTP